MAETKEKKMFYIDAELARELDLVKLTTKRPLSDLANEAISDLEEERPKLRLVVNRRRA